ncbi:hypothetical protein FOMA001_g16973 [Fusarium oxysporum f. sp. matthiolae]|nr:hypothetical protein FOMA001_g16973 [Fusarium oxysporum f. sp. matthiolae]
MWYIGPLLFWADAESACEFLILTVTCLPKMVREPSFLARVKRAFGVTSQSSIRLDKDSDLGTGSSYNPGATPQQPPDGNYELRDDFSSDNPKTES